MGIIHIENVDDAVMKALALRAERKGRSLEDEVRAVLEEVAAPETARSLRAIEADRIRAMTKGWTPETDSVSVIREMRDRER
jgi:plasmid stability protein